MASITSGESIFFGIILISAYHDSIYFRIEEQLVSERLQAQARASGRRVMLIFTARVKISD
jgi:hypothetical protein